MNRNYFFLMLCLIALFSFTGCKKMDSTYKDLVVTSGLVYPQKANSPIVFVGRNRVKIAWARGADPTVTKARIFWNNFSDSIEFDIPSSGDTISTIIDNLSEKSYDFIVKTYDSEGNSSVPVEILTRVYGDDYQASLLMTPLNAAILNNDGDVSIEWGAADITDGAFATEVQYTDAMGETKTQRSPISSPTSMIPNVKPGTTIKYRTLFIPDSMSIDTFYTDYKEQTLFLLDKSNWSIIDYSTEYPRADTRVTRIIDGDTTTRWHTWVGHTSYPEFVTVDMKVERKITYFEIWRDNGDVRACDTFQLFVSNDNVTWTDLGVFPFDRFTDVGQWYEIPSHPKARYWKFVGLSGPENYMVMGEISVYGY